jgi:hypothetical protein
MIKPLVGLEGRPALHRRLNASQYAVFVLFGIDNDYSDGGMFEVYYNSTGAIAVEAVGLLRENRGSAPRAGACAHQSTDLADGAGAVRPGCTQTGARPSGAPLIHVPDAYWMNAAAREGQLESIVERFIRSHRNDFSTESRAARDRRSVFRRSYVTTWEHEGR